jgi:hypothetical protein
LWSFSFTATDRTTRNKTTTQQIDRGFRQKLLEAAAIIKRFYVADITHAARRNPSKLSEQHLLILLIMTKKSIRKRHSLKSE